jgi:hypothetical protein
LLLLLPPPPLLLLLLVWCCRLDELEAKKELNMIWCVDRSIA